MIDKCMRFCEKKIYRCTCVWPDEVLGRRLSDFDQADLCIDKFNCNCHDALLNGSKSTEDHLIVNSLELFRIEVPSTNLWLSPWSNHIVDAGCSPASSDLMSLPYKWKLLGLLRLSQGITRRHGTLGRVKTALRKMYIILLLTDR